ncbi:MAG: DUF1573 domain-containing protein [Bacteroidales bacterium]|nr:DUF1573 domain-containing protein [Bacteroidales bacterium]
MRLLFFFIFLLSINVACNQRSVDHLPPDLVNNPKSASDKVSGNSGPVISFEKDTHDFGRIILGEKVTYSFKFTNTGQSELIISNVSSSCGCTVPTFTKTPIKVGEKGIISVAFDSENRKGFQHKTITVMTNTIPNTTTLNIKAMVVTPEKN